MNLARFAQLISCYPGSRVTEDFRLTGAHLVAVLIGLHWIAVVALSVRNSPVWHEPPHYVAGLYTWATGDHSLYRVNPPFLRLLASLPAGPPLSTEVVSVVEPFRFGERPEFACATAMADRYPNELLHAIHVGRLLCACCNAFGIWIAWKWAADLFGWRAGLAAATLYASNPYFLGNCMLVTGDAGAAAMCLWGNYRYWRYRNAATIPQAFGTGTVFGLALAMKTTALLLLMTVPCLMILHQLRRWQRQRPLTLLTSAAQATAILAGVLLVINLSYGFQGTGTSLGEFRFLSSSLTHQTVADGPRFQNRFQGTLLDWPIPLPADFVLGIDQQKLDFETRFWSFQRGSWTLGGSPEFYAYALGVKTPLGTLALCCWALFSLLRTGSRTSWFDLLALLLPSITVWTIASMNTGVHVHSRYILPALPMLWVFCGSVWEPRANSPTPDTLRLVPRLRMLFLSASVLSSLWCLPHSLSYFNESIGGPHFGQRHLLDSNVDWGQDLYFLEQWIERHVPESEPLHVRYDGLVDANTIIERTQDWPVSKEFPSGWYAISTNLLFDRQGTYSYFRNQPAVGKAGYSIWIFRIPNKSATELNGKERVTRFFDAS